MTVQGWATTVRAPSRLVGLDRLRGLAIVCMVVDHLAVVFAGPEWLRLTVGRLAMPLFFVLAGHLVSRLTRRHLLAAFAGLLLPVLVPWVDSPNVLLVYAAGAVLLVVLERAGLPAWVLIAVSLAFAANGHRLGWERSYDVLALVALMGCGRYASRADLTGLGARLPAFLAWPGRHPLSIYLGHVLALDVLVRLGVPHLLAGG